ncbi:hypothetical protein M569_03704, partial [Genlisea aurea]
LAIVDGYLMTDRSSELSEGVFVGPLSSLNSEAISSRVSDYITSFNGDLFWCLNGVGAPDPIVVHVPAGCIVETPLHLRYISMSGRDDDDSRILPVSNPRVLVLVEKGGEINVVEEYRDQGDDERRRRYWTNAVTEIVLGDGAKVRHSYVQAQSSGAAHVKWTSVHQESGSVYQLVEISSGGKLSRHNVHVQQHGPDTVTDLSTFHLSTGDQLQDLHTQLVLDHPRGFSRQLHKCIVAHSESQAVFDGSIRVNRRAQQTDAGQLTRSLLLESRGTVNVKPNLQIVADDVKCSHGAAISDLDKSQLFYFQARGIDAETARKALVFSFGEEVIQRIPEASLRKKISRDIRRLL